MGKKKQLPAHVYLKGRINKYLWFERRGWPSLKFKSQDSASPEFFAEYAAIMSGKFPAFPDIDGNANKRTFNNLARRYYKTPKYANLSHETARKYDAAIKFVLEKMGEKSVTYMKRPHVIAMRDANHTRHRFANYLVQVTRIIMETAIDLGWITENPAKGVKLLKSPYEGREPWTAELVEAFRGVADTRSLLIFELCLATGQRIGDVLNMQWADYNDGFIDVVQSKTKKKLTIPLTQRMRNILNSIIWQGGDKRSNYIVHNNLHIGRLSYKAVQDRFLILRRQIGAEKYDIHSLRYTAASEMKMAGCELDEIAAVTGQTNEMVLHYTRAVRQKANAIKAINAVERMETRLKVT